ncbi:MULTISPECIES: hypothetical protein [Alphaproteobacteria]|uniref:Uncharacterized protein n=2 Tax=Alphaproteobacteria TaxID=28211 RepID=A0A512HNP7_9HYPH|nr:MULTISPECIES: hypothetical protein [Alphaproteobacteria]GEO87064.1 hypothetical protein RNA01_39960 [Ciceribacter naphthalenivorans]GLR23150.1 hypothetical protein GCM10007920_29380 [Ciceribacter naphthalenivorans]GLT06006.1 hypothetical protein GCM10007926_29380 [Sphingomonas psychrolutea]
MKLDRLAALCLMLAIAPVLFAMETTAPHWTIVAIALVAAYIAICLRRTGFAARMMLGAAILTSALYVMLGGTASGFIQVVRQTIYLPVLIGVLVPLRVVAMEAEMVKRAGHFVVDQPPSRRFALLAIGGQIFGVLLNVGGLLILLHVALRGPMARGPDDKVAALQTRRITIAVMRGFGANIFWSPLGLGLNLLLTLMPTLTWTEFAPYGLAASVVFIAIGWLVDRLQSPPPPVARKAEASGEGWSLVGLLAILAVISGGAALIETIFGLPLRGAILVIVPLFAVGWQLAVRSAERAPYQALGELLDKTVRALPGASNEITIIASAGYLGLLIAAMIPHDAVSQLALGLGLDGGLLAVAICLLVLASSLAGLNPMIASTISVKAVVSAGLAISEPLLVLSVLVGWALALVVSPATSTLAIASSVTRKPQSTVGLRWNGAFCLAVLIVAMVIFLEIWP